METTKARVDFNEFLDLMDCSLVGVGSIHSYNTLDDMLNDLQSTHIGWLDNNVVTEDEFQELKEQSDIAFLLVDNQLNKLRTITSKVNVPFIIENLEVFIHDTFYNGIVDKTVNKTGMDITLPDMQYETLLNYLKENNKDYDICSEYMQDCIQAIIEPELFNYNITVVWNMPEHDVEVQVSNTEYLVIVTSTLGDGSISARLTKDFELKEIIDTDLNITLLDDVIDYLRQQDLT